MNRSVHIGIVCCLLLLAAESRAQFPVPDLSNLRQKKLRVQTDSLQLDTASIVPGSVSISHHTAQEYEINYVTTWFRWKQLPVADSFIISYRVFPFRLDAWVQHLNYDSVRNAFYVKPFVFRPGAQGPVKGVFDFGTLRAEGSFGRQIGFGNSQDAVLNSNFNLQLSGMLGDSIELQAALTDNNIPIQPDGNTQQLNEFDQVYLQFRKKGWQLNLGDIDLRQNQLYFLNFYKRMQGISFATENRISKSVASKTLVSGSVAKGKFTRNIIAALEGNQGPYRLKGANNEFFFIVLANTERVFLDGELLKRGEDQDYVINYNTAEITFTPARMVTKDSRIQVEFEYADRNYLNANLYLAQELELGKKISIQVAAFQNSDARNSPINQVLDDRQKQFLASLGDSIQNALYPTALEDTLLPGKILYEKIYAGADSFYQYSTQPGLARYNLSFTEVGDGRGNYIPDFNGANGKVYKYQPPVAGVKQGRFEPVQVLVAPRMHRVIALSAAYKINQSTTLHTELAMSAQDVNTFSALDNGDDQGWATRVRLNHGRKVGNRTASKLELGMSYEFTEKKFKPLERLRSVEFSRDWGLGLQAIPTAANESILKASAAITGIAQHAAATQFTWYHRDDGYNGWQQALQHQAELNRWTFSNRVTYTHYNHLLYRGSFVRPVIDVSKELNVPSRWKLGVQYALEQNAVKSIQADTLIWPSFHFDTYSVYLHSDQSKPNRYRITFFTRADQYAEGRKFSRGDRSLNLNLQTELLANPKRQLYLNATFRKLKVIDSALSKQKPDETILGRMEYVMNEWKGFLTGNILYEVGAGQEQRRDFAYLEVPAGTGQYAWIDYNNDGVQQLNEFEIAAFPDQAKFLRIFTPTNEFIKANYITLNYSFTLNPRVFTKQPVQKGIAGFFSRLLFMTSLQSAKKSVAAGRFEFNPFQYHVNDAALVTLNTTILNTLAFNRFDSKWGTEVSNLRSNGKALLTYGYESRQLSDWTMKWRWNLNRSVSLLLSAKKGKNKLSTPQFANRNYDLSVWQAEPLVTWLIGTKFRLAGGYKFDVRSNKPSLGAQKSKTHSLNLDSKYNILQRSAVMTKFTFSSIHFPFPANTSVSYIMLDGLLPGSNYLWSLGFTRRLMNNLDLTMQYDGRKSGSARTVHLGKAGITAIF